MIKYRPSKAMQQFIHWVLVGAAFAFIIYVSLSTMWPKVFP